MLVVRSLLVAIRWAFGAIGMNRLCGSRVCTILRRIVLGLRWMMLLLIVTLVRGVRLRMILLVPRVVLLQE